MTAITTDEHSPASPPPARAVPDAASTDPRKTPNTPKKSRTWMLALGVVVVLAILGACYWLYERRFEETDDAQVDTNISNVSCRVPGTITRVLVIENQRVELGDLLAEIDDRDLRIAQDLARAQLAEAEAQLAAEDPLVPITEATNQTTLTTTSADVASAEAALAHARRNLAQGAAQLVEGEANDKNIQTERARAERLIKQGAISAAERDLRASAGAASSANVEALRQAHAAAYANVEEQESHLASTRGRLRETKVNGPRQLARSRASVLLRQAAVDVARAILAQADLNLSYARIVSPVRGVIGKKAVAVGDHVGPGQELLAIAETDAPWITANFRETQLRRMHSGQSVIVHVDAIDQDLRAVVQSIGGATGSRFSVLPPENASGNYVKVVQRIPVRLQLEPSQPGLDRLRAGMSVEPKVRL